MTHEFRNAKHNHVGGIDLEWNHPDAGWLPFSASADADTDYGRELYELALESAAPHEPRPPLVPDIISDRQFFQTLANRGLISKQEALAAVKVGELPPAMLALIGQILDEDAAFAVEMAISGATTFERNHPDTELLAYLYGWDAAALDGIWIEAGNLK